MHTTKEKILEAAEKCPQAKETLKTLFPEAFSGLGVKLGSSGCDIALGTREGLQLVGASTLHDDRLFLGTNFTWKIEDGYLIPTKK
jgi:hypothetical protein